MGFYAALYEAQKEINGHLDPESNAKGRYGRRDSRALRIKLPSDIALDLRAYRRLPTGHSRGAKPQPPKPLN